MKLDSELQSLIYLMDDPDPVVEENVKKRIMARGDEAIKKLNHFIEGLKDKRQKSRYTKIVNDIKFEINFDRLKKLTTNKPFNLTKALLLASSIAEPHFVERYFLESYNRLIDKFSAELEGERTTLEQSEIFNHLFFSQFKFEDGRGRKVLPENALIDHVIFSKYGNPVSISILYFMLADGVGLSIYPLCFPGGFIPVYIDDEGEIIFYINIFNRGTPFPKSTLKEYFTRVGLPYKEEDLKRESLDALLPIYLELLSFAFGNSNQQEVVQRIERVILHFGGRRYL